MRTPILALTCIASCLALSLPVPARAALDRLDDAAMAEVSGAGIAIALNNFEFAMDPSSYFEQVGSTPANNCTATGNVAANQNCWRRGDLRWYGINISGAGGTGDGYQWNDSTTCSSSSLDCPRGGVLTWFSPFDNPYVIRAWSPQGMAYNGDCINGTDGAGGCNDAVNTAKTLYEYLAPTAQPNYTFSFWGEIEAGSTRNAQTQALTTGTGAAGWGLLKSQTIIRGNAAGSVFRMFQFTQSGNQTFAMFYHSYLRGDFRFSVNQGAAGGTDTIGAPPVFGGTEGLMFRTVNAFVPLGQLYYQALTLGAVGTGGNFYLELTPIPNNATVYTEFYGMSTGDPGSRGYETARCRVPGATAASCSGYTVNGDYVVSHGYSRWGDFYPASFNSIAGGTRNVANGFSGTNGDGIMFRACSGCSNFFAFAKRPLRIDKRGENQSRQQTQNYQCNTGNTGGCTVPGGAGGSTVIYNGSGGDSTRTYPTNVVNLGDARMEGLLIHRLHIESCPKTGAC